jgi:hypothetical protein
MVVRCIEVHIVTEVSVTATTMVVTLAMAPNPSARPLATNDVVSLRDFGVPTTSTLDAAEQAVYAFLCGCVARLRLVVTAVAETVVTLDLTKSGATNVPNGTLALDPGRSRLLNESMQHRVLLDVTRVVRRLKQRTVHV